MRGKFVERVLRRVAIGAVCVVAGGGLCWGVHFGYRYWRVERAIGRFEAGASQARADVLVGMIDSHVPTGGQGERILELLLTPRVTMRKAYPLGECPTVALEVAFSVPFQNASVARDERLLSNGMEVYSGHGGGGDVVRGMPMLRSLYPAPGECGTYEMEIQQRYALNLHHREGTWAWDPLSRPFPRGLLPYRNTVTMEFRSLEQWDYACTVTAEADVVVVEKSRAERIELVSDPNLAAAMRASFRSTAFSRTPRRSNRSAQPKSIGGLVIEWRDIPEAVGFRCLLRLSDGRMIAPKRGFSRHFCARAGSSRQFGVFPADYAFEKPGSYTGTIELRVDPDAAYGDPGIKAIWDGTLAFPISFEVFSTESGTF